MTNSFICFEPTKVEKLIRTQSDQATRDIMFPTEGLARSPSAVFGGDDTAVTAIPFAELQLVTATESDSTVSDSDFTSQNRHSFHRNSPQKSQPTQFGIVTPLILRWITSLDTATTEEGEGLKAQPVDDDWLRSREEPELLKITGFSTAALRDSICDIMQECARAAGCVVIWFTNPSASIRPGLCAE